MLVAIIVNPRYGGWYTKDRSVSGRGIARAKSDSRQLVHLPEIFLGARLDYNSSSPPSARLNYPAWTCSEDGSRGMGSLEEKAQRWEWASRDSRGRSVTPVHRVLQILRSLFGSSRVRLSKSLALIRLAEFLHLLFYFICSWHCLYPCILSIG